MHYQYRDIILYIRYRYHDITLPFFWVAPREILAEIYPLVLLFVDWLLCAFRNNLPLSFQESLLLKLIGSEVSKTPFSSILMQRSFFVFFFPLAILYSMEFSPFSWRGEINETKPPAYVMIVTLSGVTLLFNEPPDARKPNIRWRLYVFKNGEVLNGKSCRTWFFQMSSCFVSSEKHIVTHYWSNNPHWTSCWLTATRFEILCYKVTPLHTN